MSKYVMYGKTKVLNGFDRALGAYLNSIKDELTTDNALEALIRSNKIALNTDTIDAPKIYAALQELGLLYDMHTHPTVKHLQGVLDQQLNAPYKMNAWTGKGPRYASAGNMRRIYVDIPAPATGDDVVDAHIAKLKIFYNLFNNRVEVSGMMNAPTLGRWDDDDNNNNILLEMRRAKCDAILMGHEVQVRKYIKEMLRRTGYDKIKELR